MARLSALLRSLSPLLSFRLAFILLALANLKTLPFAWHIRLLSALYRHLRRSGSVTHLLSNRTVGLAYANTHPIFRPVAMYSRTPLMEIDYNLHKSNSTYFSDLDISRTALVTSLLSPKAVERTKKLEAEGYKGPLNIILGAVHTSFHKEIKAYERYQIRSRVLGWDRKWLVIGTFFIRPAKGAKAEVLLASSLSKYVIKKGRYTVPPERSLRGAGWLPEKPEGTESPEKAAELARPEETAEKPSEEQVEGAALLVPVPEAPIQAGSVIEKLEEVAVNTTNHRISGLDSLTLTTAANASQAEVWDWHRIELERVRGMNLVDGWMGIDKALMEEFATSES